MIDALYSATLILLASTLFVVLHPEKVQQDYEVPRGTVQAALAADWQLAALHEDPSARQLGVCTVAFAGRASE